MLGSCQAENGADGDRDQRDLVRRTTFLFLLCMPVPRDHLV